MEIKDAYKQVMEAQLKEWGAQIDLLEARMKNPGAALKFDIAANLHELRLKQRVAFGQMRVLGKVSGESWEQAKETAEHIWRNLRTGVVNANYKFK